MDLEKSMTKYEINTSKFFDLPDFKDIGWIDLVKEAKKNTTKNLEDALNKTNNIDFNKISWSQEFPMFEKIGKHWVVKAPNKIGVYKIIHKPTNKVMSVGQGIINARIDRHRMVFNNDGKDCVNPGGTTLPSTTGQHMYKHDTNPKNWYCSFAVTHKLKHLALELEKLLQLKYKTQTEGFNSVYQSGTY